MPTERAFETLKKHASRWIDARLDTDAIPYTESWKGRGKAGNADLIVFWDTPEQLQTLVKICHDADMVIQPRGGGTSLNDSVRPPTDDEDSRPKIVFVSQYNRMQLREEDQVVRVGAAVTPYELGEMLSAHQLQVKGCDTGAKENSQFGAMFTTNTGGSTAEVEGSLIDHVLGIRFITADGRLIEDMHPIQKDNSSLNFAKVLGYFHFPVVIITDLLLQVSPMTRQRESAMIGLDNYPAAKSLRYHLMQTMEPFLVSCELMEHDALAPVFDHVESVHNPFSKVYPITLYLQFATSLSETQLVLAEFMQHALFDYLQQSNDIADDAIVVAMDETQKENLHHIRHHITIAAGQEAANHDAFIKGYDLSIPLSELESMIETLNQLQHDILPGSLVRRFGHYLGGRLHNNIHVHRDTDPALIEMFSHQIDELIENVGGSVASEHGPGRDLVNRLPHIRPDAYAYMQHEKAYWDPKHLIAPGVGVELPSDLQSEE